jgi:hypothetical protein
MNKILIRFREIYNEELEKAEEKLDKLDDRISRLNQVRNSIMNEVLAGTFARANNELKDKS